MNISSVVSNKFFKLFILSLFNLTTENFLEELSVILDSSELFRYLFNSFKFINFWKITLLYYRLDFLIFKD